MHDWALLAKVCLNVPVVDLQSGWPTVVRGIRPLFWILYKRSQFVCFGNDMSFQQMLFSHEHPKSYWFSQ